MPDTYLHSHLSQPLLNRSMVFIAVSTLIAQTLRHAIPLILAVISMIVVPSVASAETKIGFVDIPYLIDKAPQALDAEQRLQLEFTPRQADLQLQREELNELKRRFVEDASDMSEAALAELDRDTRGLERRIKRDEQDFREELNIQKNNEFKKVRVQVLEAIARFGKSKKYDLIVSDGVLYANKQIDVTEEILESLLMAGEGIKSSN